jgi:hypothetical protein
MHVVLRLVLDCIGYLVAAMAAVLLISLVTWSRAYAPVSDDPALIGMTAFVVLTDAFVLLWILGSTALLPAMAAIVLGEALALRSWLYYAAAGLTVAFLVAHSSLLPDYPALPSDPPISAAAGLVGGLMHWLVAGRSAGLRRASRSVEASPHT